MIRHTFNRFIDFPKAKSLSPYTSVKKLLSRLNMKKSKKFFLVKSSLKTLLSRLNMKKSKKIFFGQIGLLFFVAHWPAFNSTIFGLASLDREIFCGHIGSTIEKIRREEDLHLKSKRTSFVNCL